MLKSLFKLTDETYLKEMYEDTMTTNRIKEYKEKDIQLNPTDDKGSQLIFRLIQKRKLKSLKVLLDENINLNIENKFGKTILEEAVEKEELDIIKMIMQTKYDINHINSYGRSIMHDIALFGIEKIYNIIIQYKPNLHIKDKTGKTPLYYAIENNNFHIAKELIHRMHNINDIDYKQETVLFLAVNKEDKRYLEEILKKDINVNISNEQGENALFLAIENGDENINTINALIEAGINVNIKNNEDETILEKIFKLEEKEKKLNFTKTICSIIEKGNFKINQINKNGQSLLEKEIENKNYKNIELLISYGANINKTDQNGDSILYKEILKGHTNFRMIDLLLDNGADLNLKNNKEQTILEQTIEIIGIAKGLIKEKGLNKLRVSIEDKHDLILKKILSCRPIIEKRENGQTMLFDLFLSNDFETLKTVINSGIVDLNDKDNEGRTPLMYMIEEGLKLTEKKDRDLFLERLVNILKYRIELDEQDKDGRTILHKAVIANDLEVVEKILSKKSDVNKKDLQGRTPLQHTQWKGNYKIARWLISAGANINVADNTGFTLLNYAAIFGHDKLVMTLIKSGVLMYNKNQKNKKAVEFFKSKIASLDKLTETPHTSDEKMLKALSEVVENLKKELEII